MGRPIRTPVGHLGGAAGGREQGHHGVGSQWGGIWGLISGLFYVLLLFASAAGKLRAICVPPLRCPRGISKASMRWSCPDSPSPGFLQALILWALCFW